MLVMTANASGRSFHLLESRYRSPHRVGWLLGPASLASTRISQRVPFALDNDAFASFIHQRAWDAGAWRAMLRAVWCAALTPLWVLVPDVVADREATLLNWQAYAPQALGYGWPLAFAVQDGMTAGDVPAEADVVFIGGTTQWKWRTLGYWCAHFRRVHVGRVNTADRLHLCAGSGAESADGTGWMRRGDGDRTPARSWKELEAFLSRRHAAPWFTPALGLRHPPMCPDCGSAVLSLDACADCGSPL